ncbi:MAG: hypothetical protein LBH81_03190 [Rickettsiales bacterium]|jgi:hypothetical protein|nr:hypothetical protein [Rickettsiales bacterium]
MKTKIVEAEFGIDNTIEKVAKDSAKMAKKAGAYAEVHATYNGVPLVITARMSESKIISQYTQKTKFGSSLYR